MIDIIREAGVILVPIVGSVMGYLGVKIQSVHKEVKKSNEQLHNHHNTNLREDIDKINTKIDVIFQIISGGRK